MSTSVIYRSARGYEALMRLLYGRHYAARMRVIAGQVPLGATVLELCCGPGTLYRRHLRHRAGGYIGLDVNERFVAELRRLGADARVRDLADPGQPLPRADVALIQASLYHFIPDAQQLLDRMLLAARERVIVAEPIRNLSCSRIPVIGELGRRATDPGTGGHEDRFTEATLGELMDRYQARMRDVFLIPGGREKVYVLAGGG